MNHPFTRFNLGFLRFALVEEDRAPAARIARARSIDIPCREAMLRAAALKPGCAFMSYGVSPSFSQASRITRQSRFVAASPVTKT